MKALEIVLLEGLSSKTFVLRDCETLSWYNKGEKKVQFLFEFRKQRFRRRARLLVTLNPKEKK